MSESEKKRELEKRQSLFAEETNEKKRVIHKLAIIMLSEDYTNLKEEDIR